MLHVLAGSWHCAGNAAPWFLIYSYLRNRSINYTELYMVVFTRSRCRWGGLWAAANPRMMSLINFVGMRLTANYDKVDIKNLWPLRWTCKAMRPWQGGHQEFVAFAADLQCPHGVRVSACMLLEVHDACMLLEASTRSKHLYSTVIKTNRINTIKNDNNIVNRDHCSTALQTMNRSHQ